MLRAGVDVVRLNLSHGTLESHIERVRAVRAAGERTGQVVAVLADLPGPKVRAAVVPRRGHRAGRAAPPCASCRPTRSARASTCDEICVEYPTLLDDLHVGDKVVIGDGAISLQVQQVDDEAVTTARWSPAARPRAAPACTCPATGCA